MKLIKFLNTQTGSLDQAPSPVKNNIPEWYRRAESNIFDPNGKELPGLKKCMPFMDTMITGYFIKIPVNIYVNEKNNDSSLSSLFNNKTELSIRWDGPPEYQDLISERPTELGQTMPRPAGHYKNHLTLRGDWAIKLPRGWSLLMTPPLNRYDLPFTTSSGIIDSDKFISPGNIPFFIKKGFSGVIPAGTPFVQLIPIKREEWQMIQDDKSLTDQRKREGFGVRNKGTAYKNFAWSRKKYN